MTTIITPSSLALVPSLETAWQDVDSSFERFCLTAGIGAIEQMLCEDARQLAGARHSRGGGRVGYRWGRTKGKIGFHGGKVAVHRPRVRSYDGHEVALPTWTAAQAEDWLGRWAMNLMLINVSTRKLRRAVRLPEGDLPVIAGDGTSKSAASRRFVAFAQARQLKRRWQRPHIAERFVEGGDFYARGVEQLRLARIENGMPEFVAHDVRALTGKDRSSCGRTMEELQALAVVKGVEVDPEIEIHGQYGAYFPGGSRQPQKSAPRRKASAAVQ
jgi:hypothetical protein